MSEHITIIFTHFGYSNYLPFTLECAKRTNPKARLVFLGDEKNQEIAAQQGWEHHSFKSYSDSELNAEFEKVYRPIKGRNHDVMHNAEFWLKFVFQRWFFVENFIAQEKIKNFWHFDSDTMILQDLGSLKEQFDQLDFTTQCRDTCLNGYVKAEVLPEYCKHICNLFKNEPFLTKQQKEFDTVNPTYAFTEMRAFADYMKSSNRKHLHLMNFSSDRVFDDCICHDDQFEMARLKSGENVKNISSRNMKFFGVKDERQIEFITLNFSWVPNYTFKWVLDHLQNDKGVFFLSDAKEPISLAAKTALKKMIKKILR